MAATPRLTLHSVAAIVAVVGIAVFARCVHGGLVWDDRAAVQSNGDVTGSNPMHMLLDHDFWGQDITATSSHKSFRPIAVASLRLDSWIQQLPQLWRMPTNSIFHAINIFLHSICAAAIVYIGELLGLPIIRSALAGLLFAVHPVHTEAVCSIVSRADLLSTGALLGAIICYASAARNLEDTAFRAPTIASSDSQPRSFSSWLFSIPGQLLSAVTGPVAGIVFAWVLAAVGTFSKETGLMIAPTLVLVDLFLVPLFRTARAPAEADEQNDSLRGTAITPGRSATPRERVIEASKSPSRPRKGASKGDPVEKNSAPAGLYALFMSVYALITGDTGIPSATWSKDSSIITWLVGERSFRMVATAALSVALLQIRLHANRGGGFYKWSVFENQMAVMPPGTSRILTLIHSHAWYAYLLLFPKDLAYLHGYAQLEPVESIWDVRALTGLFLYAVLAASVLSLISSRSRVGLWCVAASLVSFVLASNTIVWVGTEVAERLLYQPSAPAVLGFVAVLPIQHLDVASSSMATLTSSTPAMEQAVALGAVLVVSCWWSVLRSADWQSELTLFERGYAVSPRDVRAANNLAMALLGSPVSSPQERIAIRARAATMLEDAVSQKPQLQYLAAANRAALAWTERDRQTALKYGWQAVNASASAGVPDRLPCSTAANLASVYLSMAQEDGSTDMDKDLPWAIEAGGSTQATWRASILSAPALGHISPAGLAEVAAQVAISGGCWNPEMLHIVGCTLLILDQEVGTYGPGNVVLPPRVTPGPGPALFDFLQSLLAAGLGITAFRTDSGEPVGVLVAPELPAVPNDAPSVASSVDYATPDASVSPYCALIVHVVVLPFRGSGGGMITSARKSTETPLQAPTGELTDAISGAPGVSREQTSSTLNMMATAARQLASSDAVSNGDPSAAANLNSLSDGLARIAIFLRPDRPAYRTNLAIHWSTQAELLAAAAPSGDASSYFAAAAAEARAALDIASRQGTVGPALAPYWSNVGYVYERASHIGTQDNAELLAAALEAYTTAAGLAPAHTTITANAIRLAQAVESLRAPADGTS